MPRLTTHVLDATNGAHAAGVRVELYRVHESGARELLFADVTDADGRLQQSFTAARGAACALVFYAAEYFAARGMPAGGARETAFHFSAGDENATHHMPMIVSPTSCTVWWSS